MLKLEGSTIIEALVAMTITTIVFVATLSIFLNTTRDFNHPLKVKGAIILNNKVIDIQNTGVLIPNVTTEGNLLVDSQFDIYNGNPNLYLVTLSAYRRDNNRLILQRRILLQSNEIEIINSNY